MIIFCNYSKLNMNMEEKTIIKDMATMPNGIMQNNASEYV